MKKIKIGRRELLLNSAAFCLAAPALRIFETDAYAQANPKRFVMFSSANGTFHQNFWPGALTNDDGFRNGRLDNNFNNRDTQLTNIAVLPQIIRPFDSLKDSLLLVHGVNVVANNPNREDHSWGRHRAFTGLASTDRNGTARSLDVHVANALGGGPLLPIGVQYYDRYNTGRISFQNTGNPTVVLDEPGQIFAAVTGNADNGQPSEPIDTKFLDSAAAGLKDLLPQFSGPARLRIEQNLDALSDASKLLNGSLAAACQNNENISVPIKNPADGRTYFDTAVCDFNIEMLVTALSCGYTQTASFMFGTSASELVYRHLQVAGSAITASHHSLSHQGKDTVNDQLLAPNWREQLTAVCQYQASVIAGFAARLAAIPEGNSNMLDNTIILWENELAIGDPHQHNTHPTLLLGGKNLGVRGGRLLSRFDQAPESAIYLNAICERLGVAKIVGDKASLTGIS